MYIQLWKSPRAGIILISRGVILISIGDIPEVRSFVCIDTAFNNTQSYTITDT